MAERTGTKGSGSSGNIGSTQKSNQSDTNVKSGSGNSTGKSDSMNTSGNSRTENLSSPGISHSSELSGSRSSSEGSKQNLEGVLGLLQKLGMEEDHLRQYVSDTVTNKIQKIDFRDVMERAKEYASMSGDKLKDLSAKNPKMFYSGLAAFILGAGMMASAARRSDHSIPDEMPTVGDDPRPII